MADTPSKRQREETQIEDVNEESKRHKSYNHILSLLEEEEEEPNEDLSSLITTLQQEITADTTVTDRKNEIPTAIATAVEDYDQSFSSFSSSSSTSSLLKEDDEDDKERVIRHLLEASDDELGIPNREEVVGGSVGDGYEYEGFNGVDGSGFCDVLWEIEDANANYYALLQSELFM